MADKVDEALVTALARVQIAQSRIQALLFALEGIPQKDRSGPVDAAADKIYRQLVDSENNAYRQLFMLSLLGNEADRLRATEMALERFMSEGTAIMELLHQSPVGCWFKSEEEKFRADIAFHAARVREAANHGAVPESAG